jgi:hypothetical protein
MQAKNLTRRFVLLLPLAIAACGGEDEDLAFQPLRFNDLPPIQLKVASIAIEQRFIPAGAPPDVSDRDPTPPVDALKAMCNDRLQAFGTANKAVFSVLDASLTRINDILTGSFVVSLAILDDNGTQLGFAEARVQTRHTGRIDGLRPVLYDTTKAMMNDMNIEFEYQIRHNLKNWLTDVAAPDTPVEQTPLDSSGAPMTPPPTSPAPQNLPPQGYPAQGYPPQNYAPQNYPPQNYAPGSLAPPAPAPQAPASPPSYTPAYPPTYLQLPQPQPQ